MLSSMAENQPYYNQLLVVRRIYKRHDNTERCRTKTHPAEALSLSPVPPLHWGLA
jgi:hypothetical protein